MRTSKFAALCAGRRGDALRADWRLPRASVNSPAGLRIKSSASLMALRLSRYSPPRRYGYFDSRKRYFAECYHASTVAAAIFAAAVAYMRHCTRLTMLIDAFLVSNIICPAASHWRRIISRPKMPARYAWFLLSKPSLGNAASRLSSRRISYVSSGKKPARIITSDDYVDKAIHSFA